MKKTVLLFTAILFLVACKSQDDELQENESGDIKVSYINNTGQTITDVVANGLSIGTLTAGKTTRFYAYEHFGMDSGMPDAPFTGIINREKIESSNKYYWCGTEKSYLPTGQYVVEVNLSEYGNEKLFNLRFVSINK